MLHESFTKQNMDREPLKGHYYDSLTSLSYISSHSQQSLKCQHAENFTPVMLLESSQLI